MIGDVKSAVAGDWAFYTGRLNGPVDRSDWIMTPPTNDAYNGSLRDIVFPAAILQPPIFDENADPAINYGAVGRLIGHELTHGFDDQGRKIDADGDGLTGDKRVFLDWAQAWRGKASDDAMRKRLVSDPHSPAQFRVNGVMRNIDAWYAAFGVKPGAALYVPPKDRVKIW